MERALCKFSKFVQINIACTTTNDNINSNYNNKVKKKGKLPNHYTCYTNSANILRIATITDKAHHCMPLSFSY